MPRTPKGGSAGTVMPGERAQAVAAIEVLLRIMRTAVDCFEGDDLETLLVFLAVVAASVGSFLRNPDAVELAHREPLGEPMYKSVSGRAIADSVGLPRETVRRRIDALVAQGRLQRDRSGVRIVRDTISYGRNLEFSRSLIRELRAADGKLARFAPD